MTPACRDAPLVGDAKALTHVGVIRSARGLAAPGSIAHAGLLAEVALGDFT
jgi:hypothetical protein